MPLDPNILLQGRVADIGGSFLRGFQGVENIRQQRQAGDRQERLLQLQEGRFQAEQSKEAQLKAKKEVALAYASIEDDLIAGNTESVISSLSQRLQTSQGLTRDALEQTVGVLKDNPQQARRLIPEVLEQSRFEKLIPADPEMSKQELKLTTEQNLPALQNQRASKMNELDTETDPGRRRLLEREVAEINTMINTKATGTQRQIQGTTESKVLPKVLEDRIKKGSERAIAARKVSQAVGQGIEQLKSGIETGTFERAKLTIAKVFEGAGLPSFADKISNITDAETFNKVSSQITLDALKTFELYPVSNVDLKKVSESLSNITSTEEANMFVLRALREGAFQDIIQDEINQDALIGNPTSEGVQKTIREQERIIRSPDFKRFRTAKSGKPVWFNEYYRVVRREKPNATFAEIVNMWQKND